MNLLPRGLIKALAALVLACPALTGPILAQATYNTHTEWMATAPGMLARKQPMPLPADATRPNEVVGMIVINRQDKKLGRVEDLIIDLESGRIVQVVLSTGGFLGYGVTMTAVPPEILLHNEALKVLVLNVSDEKLNGAPRFNLSKWVEYSDAAHLTSLYGYYGVTAPASSFAHIQRTNNLIGMPVKNLQDEKLGNVENVVMDLSNRRVVSLVFSSGNSADGSTRLNSVPPSSLRFTSDRTALQLDLSKDLLSQAPHFAVNNWQNYGEAGQPSGVFRPSSEELQLASTRTDQTDTAITARIREKIILDKSMSLNAQNVKIVTTNGRVTLRGQVDNADEKRRIGAIADRIVLPANVDNQLQVKLLVSLNN